MFDIKATKDLNVTNFAVHAASPLGDQAVLDGAKAMAMTVVDFWLQPSARDAARAAFDAGPSGPSEREARPRPTDS